MGQSVPRLRLGRPLRPYKGSAEEINGCLGHDDLHDGLAPAGARDRARFGIGVAAATHERRIANTPRSLAAGAPCRSARGEASLLVERHRADGPVAVAQVKFRGMVARTATPPGGALALNHQLFRRAERQALLDGKLLGTGANQHHVLAGFEHLARQANGVADALDRRYGAGPEARAIHDDGVELDVAFAVQVRTDAGIECGVVLQHHDGRFDGVERGAAALEDFPSGFECAAAPIAAVLNGFVGDVPGTTVDN